MSKQRHDHPEQQASLTAHAWLIPLGVFAHQIGLIDELKTIPIRQKTVTHSPQTKLIQFLVAHLAGCDHLKDMSQSAHPLDQDQAVAKAWAQPGWADYSGVSRTLSACDETTLAALDAVIRQISLPFLRQEAEFALSQKGHLMLDFDLTGRPVSATSTTYPDAAFGYMANEIQFGYQAALSSLHSPTYGRLWLNVRQHPGNTVAPALVEEFVATAETALGMRPRRRTELVEQRLLALRMELVNPRLDREVVEDEIEQLTEKLSWLKEAATNLQVVLARQEAKTPADQRPPHGKIARLQQMARAAQKRVQRHQERLETLQRRHQRLCQKEQDLLDEIGQLDGWLTQLQHENETNPKPVPMHLRVDSAFARVPNLAMLIELGYDIYTRAPHAHLTRRVQKWIEPETQWTQANGLREMTAWTGKEVGTYPYPLDVALTRTRKKEEEATYGVLLHYGSTPVTDDLCAWSRTYNGRQTIEAGIKEGKGIFKMGHLKVRGAVGLQIQERFAIVAANLVRWSAHALQTDCAQIPVDLAIQPISIKRWIQVAMNTTAWVQRHQDQWRLRFTAVSAYADLELAFPSGQLAIQWRLPLFIPP